MARQRGLESGGGENAAYVPTNWFQCHDGGFSKRYARANPPLGAEIAVSVTSPR